jgi:hypothetical protein
MNKNDFFERKHLAKEDLRNPIVVSISHVKAEMLKSQNGPDERKPILHFAGTALKPMVLNVINWTTIEENYGPEVERWTGKSIELYVDPNVFMAGKRVGGIRVRIPSSRPAQQNTNGNGKSLMNLPMAVAALQAVGITKDTLIQVIKSKGFSGWMAERDTPTVLAMIKEAQENQQRGKEESFDDAPPAIPSPDEEIPFSFWIGLIAAGLSMISTIA